MYRNYIRIVTCHQEEDFIPRSIDNTTLQRAPTLPTAPNTITSNHLSIPPPTTDMSEYESSASDFSHTDYKYNLCRSRGKATGHHHTCPYPDDDYWEQFVSHFEDTQFTGITPPSEPQEPDSTPLTPIDTTIFEAYTPLTVVQIGVK